MFCEAVCVDLEDMFTIWMGMERDSEEFWSVFSESAWSRHLDI